MTASQASQTSAGPPQLRQRPPPTTAATGANSVGSKDRGAAAVLMDVSRDRQSAASSSVRHLQQHQQQQQQQQQQQHQPRQPRRRGSSTSNPQQQPSGRPAPSGSSTAAPAAPPPASAPSNPHNSAVAAAAATAAATDFNIDLGDLTQTPRRRSSTVPPSGLPFYRLLRRVLGLLTCVVTVSDLLLAVSDIVVGFSMLHLSPAWTCDSPVAGRAVFASGITGLVFCFSLVATQYLATGNTVVHSSITSILAVISLSHTCAALPRIRFSYLSSGCTGRASAYLLLTSITRAVTLMLTGAYYGLLNYYACKFGEDNATGGPSSAAGGGSATVAGSGGGGRK